MPFGLTPSSLATPESGFDQTRRYRSRRDRAIGRRVLTAAGYIDALTLRYSIASEGGVQRFRELGRMRAVAAVISGKDERLDAQLRGESHAGAVCSVASAFAANGDNDVR